MTSSQRINLEETPKLSKRDETKIMILTKKQPSRGAVSIANEISSVKGEKISAETVRRVLHRKGYHGRKNGSKAFHQSSNEKTSIKLCQTVCRQGQNVLGKYNICG